jgi:integrase/recombinase XerD
MIALEPDKRNRVLLAVLYAAGLRVSEACGLRWRDLQARGNAGQILVHGKGGRTRVVVLPPGCGANSSDWGPQRARTRQCSRRVRASGWNALA